MHQLSLIDEQYTVTPGDAGGAMTRIGHDMGYTYSNQPDSDVAPQCDLARYEHQPELVEECLRLQSSDQRAEGIIADQRAQGIIAGQRARGIIELSGYGQWC